MPVCLSFTVAGYHHICNFKCRLDCRYYPQNIFNAKNFNPYKKPISLLNVPVCTQGMQRTWWPEAGTIIVTGPHYRNMSKSWSGLANLFLVKEELDVVFGSTNIANFQPQRLIFLPCVSASNDHDYLFQLQYISTLPAAYVQNGPR